MTQGLIFSKNKTKNCSRPQAFAKVTYHGFFKCEGKCYPNTQLEIVLENVIINYILLMMINDLLMHEILMDCNTNIIGLWKKTNMTGQGILKGSLM